MGYYSQVSLTVRETDFRSFLEEKLVDAQTNAAVLSLLKGAELFKSPLGNDEYLITLAWRYIKWYDEFEEIRAVMDFAGSVESRFIRVGEVNGDIEVADTSDCEEFWTAADTVTTINISGEEVGLEDFAPRKQRCI